MKLKHIQIINGPNLNLLGVREPEIYGNQSFEDYFETIKKKYPDTVLHYFQTNHEGSIIDCLHQVGFHYHGIILNSGAYTHYSYAIADAIKAISIPVIEVHISDIHNREDFRKNVVTGAVCKEMIAGFGLKGYEMGIEKLLEL